MLTTESESDPSEEDAEPVDCLVPWKPVDETE